MSKPVLSYTCSLGKFRRGHARSFKNGLLESAANSAPPSREDWKNLRWLALTFFVGLFYGGQNDGIFKNGKNDGGSGYETFTGRRNGVKKTRLRPNASARKLPGWRSLNPRTSHNVPAKSAVQNVRAFGSFGSSTSPCLTLAEMAPLILLKILIDM